MTDVRCHVGRGTRIAQAERATGQGPIIIHNRNDYRPHVEIDARTYEVRADGELLTCAPPKELPLAQRYFLF